MKLLAKTNFFEGIKINIKCSEQEMSDLQVFIFEGSILKKHPYKIFGNIIEITILSKKEKSTVVQLTLKCQNVVLYTIRMRIHKKRIVENAIDEKNTDSHYLRDNIVVDVNEIYKSAIGLLQGKVMN